MRRSIWTLTGTILDQTRPDLGPDGMAIQLHTLTIIRFTFISSFVPAVSLNASRLHEEHTTLNVLYLFIEYNSDVYCRKPIFTATQYSTVRTSWHVVLLALHHNITTSLTLAIGRPLYTSQLSGPRSRCTSNSANAHEQSSPLPDHE